MAAELQRLNHRHVAILHWMLANPHRTLGECARELGYTQGWLSMVIHSDIFQDSYRKALEMSNGETVATLRDRMTGIAHLALEKLALQLEVNEHPDFLLKTTDLVLKGLGYTGNKGTVVNVQNNNQTVQYGTVAPEVIRAAEEKRRQLAALAHEDIIDVPTSDQEAKLGGPAGNPARLYQTDQADGQASGGAGV